MTLKFLLDTDIVSAPVLKEPDQTLIRRIDQHSHESAIAAPIWHELLYGIERLPRGKRRSAIAEYVNDVVGASFPILPYDTEAAAWHGQERARLDKLWTPAPFVDGQIAAVTRTNDLILVTGNLKHFRRFKGLHATDWSSRS